MLNISKFFQKFQKINSDSAAQKEKIISIVKSVTNLELKPGEINVKESKLYINASPLIRNEIMMYKSKILSELDKNQIFIQDIK